MIELLHGKFDLEKSNNLTQTEVMEWEENGWHYCLKPTGNMRFIISSPKVKIAEESVVDVQQSNQLVIVDIKGVAEFLKVCESTVNNMRRDGIIHGVKLGDGEKAPVRFNLQDVWNDIQKFNSKT